MPDDDDKSAVNTWPSVDYDAFYLELGRCIARWTEIESKLFHIFQLVLNVNKTFSGIIFDNIDSLEAKFNIVTEMLRCDVNFAPPKSGAHEHKIMKDWLSVKNTICEKRNIRNSLCHHPVKSLVEVKGIRIDKIYLEINLTEAAQTRGRIAKKKFKIGDLKSHHAEMMQLQNKLGIFIGTYHEYTLKSK